jgi:hypothetical protein
VSLGEDWPTDEFRELLEYYGLRIIQRERRRSGLAPWRTFLPPDGQSVYDPNATWTETHYTFRRNVCCESCDRSFGYAFEVDQISRVHKSGRSTDGALRRELGRQLRRRIRCPHCGARQREPRRTLVRQDRSQTAFGCGLVLGGLGLIALLGILGGYVAGIGGLLVGLSLGLVASMAIWYYALPYLLTGGPPI